MSNSSLICYTRISPNRTVKRNHKIDTITIHCMAGNLSVEGCGSLFSSPAQQASSNYGIGSDGRIGMYVEEADRSWCSSSPSNDNRAITIEVANDRSDLHVSDAALKSLINLCVDICKRNNIKKLMWKADKSLIGQVDKQNMTVHRWFANKSCPGDYLFNKLSYIASEVNKSLKANTGKIKYFKGMPVVYNREIKKLQSALNADGFTDSKGRKLNEHGKVNANVWSAASKVLLSKTSRNKYPNITRWIQNRLGTSADGDYYLASASAASTYQKSRGLVIDGVVGKKTIQQLIKDCF